MGYFLTREYFFLYSDIDTLRNEANNLVIGIIYNKYDDYSVYKDVLIPNDFKYALIIKFTINKEYLNIIELRYYYRTSTMSESGTLIKNSEIIEIDSWFMTPIQHKIFECADINTYKKIGEDSVNDMIHNSLITRKFKNNL